MWKLVGKQFKSLVDKKIVSCEEIKMCWFA